MVVDRVRGCGFTQKYLLVWWFKYCHDLPVEYVVHRVAMNRKNAPVKGKYSCIKVDEFLHIPAMKVLFHLCHKEKAGKRMYFHKRAETSSAVISGQDAHAQNRRWDS
jgi:hypothetical protein